ncbi:MAG: TIGR03986 family CRISPR-associated RAMP protein [Bacteroidales bacterium]|nr:TIGR03986 family CRISPR-associated RAMP protein [Candidatus Equimonas faecalis]
MITAPYNFVPLSEKVFYPDWADQVSHDVPFEDGEDGIIKLTIKNVSPLFIRNGGKRDAQEVYSSHIMNEGSRLYFIPGSTLRGTFRSVMEILSFGKMEQYNRDSFGLQREFGKDNPASSHYKAAVKSVRCGWLIRKEEDYVIYPCAKGIQEISHKDITARFPSFFHGEDHKSAECKQKSLEEGNLYPSIFIENNAIAFSDAGKKHIVPEGYYTIVCTGFFGSKNHEYLFSKEENEPLRVSEEVFKQFDSIHKHTEFYNGQHGQGGFLKKRLQCGNKIPVFFVSDGNKVKAIGITKMFRAPYDYNIEDAVNNCRRTPDNKDTPDMAQTIFGFINGRKSLKGRVQFSHAFCNNTISDQQLIPVAGVQGQPSASFFPLYLRRNNGEAQTLNARGVQIAGRKRYRIAQGGKTFNLPQGNGNEKVGTTFQALPQGNEFMCYVSVHNLRKAEIGALLASITLFGTPDTYHNIGLAKSFGFGKVQCKAELEGFAYSIDEYQRAFEVLLLDNKIDIHEEESYRALMAICSEHTEQEMKMMDLEGYKTAKQNKHEQAVGINERKDPRFAITHEEYEEIKERRKEQEAQNAAKADKLESLRQYLFSADSYIQLKLWHEALQPLSEAQKLAQETGEKEAEIQEKISFCEAQIKAKASMPLAEFLAGQSKLGTIAGKTEKWTKTNTFTEAEINVLANLVKSLPPKETKSFAKNRGKFVKAIGEAYTAKLEEKINA